MEQGDGEEGATNKTPTAECHWKTLTTKHTQQNTTVGEKPATNKIPTDRMPLEDINSKVSTAESYSRR